MTDRLDRIERILETMASGLNQVAEQQKINTTAIAKVNAQLEASVSDLVRLFLESIEEAEADRAAIREMQVEAEADRVAIREMQSEVRGLQSENRRILEYLSSRNGGSSLT
ncbi:MAG: hypothetical protein H0X31_19200 [Nostocaceae cyanobacterium]|nr:hypothetical protein [Nostocaceae cyanobacterium]